MSKPLPAGPTLNPEYNELLVRWAQDGHPSDPECEECSDDLTGKEVHETSTNWLCTPCHEKHEGFEALAAPDEECFDYGDVSPRHNKDREDFHADDGLGSCED